MMNHRLASWLLAISMAAGLCTPAGVLARESVAASAVQSWEERADTTWYIQDPGQSSYTLSTSDQLAGVAVLVNEGITTFSGVTLNLAGDLDLEQIQWIPIGFSTYDSQSQTYRQRPFEGIFNGRGYRIEGLYINAPDQNNQALFGVIGGGASIQNVSVYGSVRAASGAAGLVASNNVDLGQKESRIVNCNNYASVYGSSYVSGIAGFFHDGTIMNCNNFGSLSGPQDASAVGGIIGDQNGSLVMSGCTNYGTISGHYSVGGLVGMLLATGGHNRLGKIDLGSCANYGEVYCTGSYAGGIIGIGYAEDEGSQAFITNCSNSASIRTATDQSGLYGTGGIIGTIGGRNKGEFVLSRSLNTGSVGTSQGTGAYAGAIVGTQLGGEVTNCYYLSAQDLQGIGYLQTGLEDETLGMDKDSLASGQTCWNLQQGQGLLYWGQDLPEDDAPELLSVRVGQERTISQVIQTVVSFSPAQGTEEIVYMNPGTVLSGYAPLQALVPEGAAVTWHLNSASGPQVTNLSGSFGAQETTAALVGVLDGDSQAPSTPPASSGIPVLPGQSLPSSNQGTAGTNNGVSGYGPGFGQVGCQEITDDEGNVTVYSYLEDGLKTVTITRPTGTVSGYLATVPSSDFYVLPCAGIAGNITDPAKAPVVVVTAPEEGTVIVPILEGTSYYGTTAIDTLNDQALSTSVPYPASGYLSIPVSQGTNELIVCYTAGSFSDVGNSDWFTPYVRFVSSRKIMKGLSSDNSGLFDPDGILIRGQVAQLIWNFFGNPSVAGMENPFPGERDNWWNEAATWAYDRGIMTGYEDGQFGGADPISREQFVTILWRMSGSPAVSTSVLYDYSDGGEVSSFARQAMAWAVSLRLIGVNSDLNPVDESTRAEAAAMMYRYIRSEFGRSVEIETCTGPSACQPETACLNACS